MIFRFCFRVGDTGEVPEELVARIDVHHPRLAAGPANMSITMPRLAQAQEPVVHEDAGELVADGAMDQRRRDARIDAAAQAEQDFLVPTCSRMRATASSM